METIQFFVLYVKYKIVNEKPEIYLFGNTAKGERVIVIDDRFGPYFYIIPKNRP